MYVCGVERLAVAELVCMVAGEASTSSTCTCVVTHVHHDMHVRITKYSTCRPLRLSFTCTLLLRISTGT